MATRIWAINPGDNEYQVTDGVGAANATKNIELTVNLANCLAGNTVPISREELIHCVEEVKNYILRGPWPPA